VLTNFDECFEMAIAILKNDISSSNQRSQNMRDLPQNASVASKLITECRDVFLRKNRIDSSSNSADKFDGIFIGHINQIVAAQNLGFIEYGHRKFFFKFKTGPFLAGQKVRFKVRKVGDTHEAFDVIPL
jgi:hypothetical protein